jgi:hypothetical protein
MPKNSFSDLSKPLCRLNLSRIHLENNELNNTIIIKSIINSKIVLIQPILSRGVWIPEIIARAFKS